MQSRAVRLILLLLFFTAILTSTFLFWKGSGEAARAAAAAKTFDDAVHAVERGLLNLRAAQPAYASANQPADRWTTKVGAELESLRANVQSVRAEAATAEGRASLDRVAASINAFAKSNARAVEYLKNDNRTLASDVVFGEGLEQTNAALDSVAQARAAELSAREAAVRVFRTRQAFAVAAGAAASVLVVLLLVPVPRGGSEAPVAVQKVAGLPKREDTVRDHEVDGEIVSPTRRAVGAEAIEAMESIDGGPAGAPLEVPIAASVLASLEPAETRMEAEPPPIEPIEFSPQRAPAAEPAASRTDFAGVASLCLDLARVVDTRALPSLLDRTAELLDASGIILWIADPDGRELNPIFAQGYPQQLVNRLGTIPRDAENATAAAFRTSLLQTVMADSISGGAIAAPLVTAGGCVGVMAAEVRHDSERQDAKLAAATIVAAQLATLVGPPSARPQTRTASGA
jgi:hypothetical protein